MMHGPEKSDPVIVAGKPTNKAERSAAELVEPRTGTKGNADRQSTHWTQSQARVSQALERIRQAVAVTHPRWEPHAGKPHVRICAGGARQLASLPLRRRTFIAGLGSAAAWPMVTRAQQRAGFTVGWLSIISPAAAVYLPVFKQGLADLGYVEGQNLTIEYRWAEGHVEKLPTLAADLVTKKVNVIASGSGLATALAAKAASSSIPLTFFIAEDPVRGGLVNSLNRPGGNVTGVTALSVELTMKHVELMHDLLPDAAHVAILVNPRNNDDEIGRAAQEGAARFGHQAIILKAATPADFDAAFDRMPKGTGGLIIPSDPLFATNHERLAGLAERLKVPTIFGDGNSEAGGLISYGPRLPQMFRELGHYTGKLLGGANPADLPIQQPTNLPLKINLLTAKIIGVEIPPSLLARADEVIE